MPSNLSSSVDKTGMVFKIIKFSIPSWVSFGVNIGAAIIATRYFPLSDYGFINTFAATSTLAMGVACLGVDSGFMRYFHDPPPGITKNQLFSLSLGTALLTIFVLSLLAFAFIPFKLSSLLFGRESYSLLALLAGNVIALVIIRFFTIYHRMESNTFLYAIITIAMQLALKGALIFSAFINPTESYAIQISVGAMLLTVAVFILVSGRRILEPIPKTLFGQVSTLKSYFHYSLYTWPVPILLYLNTVVTLIIIREGLGSSEVGLFTSVSVFVGVISVLQAGFSTFWSGFMFEHYHTQSEFIRKVHDYVCIALVLMMAGFVVGRELIYILLGKDYWLSKPFFAIILMQPILLILSETTCYGISIAKKTRILLVTTVLSVLTNLTITLLLMDAIGILAAAWASAFSGMVFFGLQTFYGQKYYRSVESVARMIFSVCCVFILATTNLVLDNLPELRIPAAILITIVAVYVYRTTIATAKNFLTALLFKKVHLG